MTEKIKREKSFLSETLFIEISGNVTVVNMVLSQINMMIQNFKKYHFDFLISVPSQSGGGGSFWYWSHLSIKSLAT